MRSATRPSVQCYLILAYLQYSKFNIVYRSHSPCNPSLILCLHGCAMTCASNSTFAQCKIFLWGSLLKLRRMSKKRSVYAIFFVVNTHKPPAKLHQSQEKRFSFFKSKTTFPLALAPETAAKDNTRRHPLFVGFFVKYSENGHV